MADFTLTIDVPNAKVTDFVAALRWNYGPIVDVYFIPSSINSFTTDNTDGVLLDGNHGNTIPTTTNGSGTGMIVSLDIVSGIPEVLIETPGLGYEVGDSITIAESLNFSDADTGSFDTVVTQVVEASTQRDRTNDELKEILKQIIVENMKQTYRAHQTLLKEQSDPTVIDIL
jgi:hypothetical protein